MIIASNRALNLPEPSHALSQRLREINIKVMGWTIGLLALLGVACGSILLISNYVADTQLRLSLLAESMQAPMSFQDERAAAVVLATLYLVPDIRYAELYRPNGASFGIYARAELNAALERTPPPRDGFRIEPTRLLFSRAVRVGNDDLGFLVLSMDLASYYRQLALLLLLALLVFPMAVMLAMWRQSKLVNGLTAPLSDLAERINRVAAGNLQQGQAIPLCHVREIDRLNVGLTQMVDEIEQRDLLLAQQVDTLEDEVERRTAELRISRDAAEAGSRAKSEFLATMSHEIRTPMNGVLGMTELLQQTALDASQKHFLDAVASSGRHLLSIISDILDFSKIESGAIELELVDINLFDLIEETAVMFSQQIQVKGLELAVDLPDGAPVMIKADPLRLRQILANLLGNAVKFTDRGEITIRLLVTPLPAAQVALTLSVIDTGVGIAAEAQERIFQQFAQADGSTSRRFGGTGLGLTISRMLAQRMGGEIRVDSVLDVGTAFHLALTLARGENSNSSLETLPSLAGEQVLVVDDNQTNRAILACQLMGFGMTPHIADSGMAALALLQAQVDLGKPVTVTLLDMDMPDMNGEELARRIRAEQHFDRMHLILLSSASDKPDGSVRSALRIACCLDKPVRQIELRRALTQVIYGDAIAAVAPFEMVQATEYRGAKVLLAEDNVVNQMLAMAWLSRLGVDVELATNGVEVLQRLREAHFSLVLMDCQMPVMDGFDTTRAIRAAEAANNTARIPILALTANVVAGDRERCLDAGMDDYLAKPYSGAELSIAVARWLPLSVGHSLPALPASLEESTVAVQEQRAPTGDVPVLNTAVLAKMREILPVGGDALVDQVIGAYRVSASAHVLALGQASANADCPAIASHAHALKSSSQNIGAEGLSQLLARLERAGRAAEMAVCTTLVIDVSGEFDRVCAALDARREGLPQ